MQTAIFILHHYGVLLIVALVLFGFGRQMLRRLEFGSALEEVSFSTGLGLGLLGTLLFLLGLVRLLYVESLVILLVLMVAASLPAWRSIVARLRRAWRDLAIRSSRTSRVLGILVAIVALVVLLPIFMKPFYPPHQWDAISYHLAVAKSYATNHSVEPLPHLRFCVFPQLLNMLFAAMLLLQDDIAAQLVNFLAMVLTGLSLLGWGSRRFSFRAGVLGTALFLGSPMILFLGSSAYIDMGLTMFVTLAILAMLNWAESRQDGWAVLAGALIGFAAAVKYTGAFLVLAFLIVVIVRSWRARAWRVVGAFLVAVLLTAGPWYVRNVVYTSDPFFPMMGRTVANPCWNVADAELQANDLVRHGGERSVLSFLRLPWDLTFHQGRFFQDFGTPASSAIFILLPLTIWFGVVNSLARRLLLVVLAFTIFWFLFAPLIRYIQPIVPIWSLVTAAAIDRLLLRFRTPPAVTVLSGVAICTFLLWQGRTRELPQHNPVPVTDVERDIYLSRFPTYSCYSWLNRHRGENYRVFSFGDEYMAYFADGIRLGDHMGPGRYSDLDLTSAQGLYRSLRRLQIDYLMTVDPASLAVRADPQFPRYFQIVCANAYSMAWRLTEQRVEAVRGRNVMANPGLEAMRDQRPVRWGEVGSPLIDASGRKSVEGAVAFRADRANYLFPTVTVIGDQLYEVGFWARAERESEEVRFEFHWQDSQSISLGAATQLFQVGPEWTELILPLTTPVGASRVVLYPHASEGLVWFDDFSVRPVFYPGSPSGEGGKVLHPGRAPEIFPIKKQDRTDSVKVLTVMVEDLDGADDIAWLDLILGDEFRRDGTCSIRWAAGELILFDDDGVGVAGHLRPGTDSVVENSYCRITGSGLSPHAEGPRLVLEMQVTLKDGDSLPRAYGRAQDMGGQTHFWEPLEWADGGSVDE